MELHRINRRLGKHPARMIICSFAIADLLGALFLFLPCSHRGNLPLIDALFTSTSAICVTGLTVVNTALIFSRFGKIIILILIQLGGLGVMTFSMLFALGFKRSLSFSSRLAIQESFLPYGLPDPKVLIFTIFLFTFITESLISLGLFICFLSHHFPLKEALFHAIFHAVSAFCNAGFSTLPHGLMSLNQVYSIPIIIMIAIILGNTGFPVIYELITYPRRKRFSLHLRLTLNVHLFLILVGLVAFLWFERKGFMRSLPWSLKILTALFHSVSARTAGFNTYDISQFSEHSIYVFLVLMFIGACPGSTGGGIKTTTIAVLWFTAISRLRGFQQTVAFKRSIPQSLVNKAVTLVMLSLVVIMVFHFLLTIGEPNIPFFLSQHDFMSILFEVISALGTVGLSTGLTPNLNFWGKICIILAMFVGRVGLLSLLSFLSQVSKEPKPYRYAKEEVMIG